MLGVLRNSTTSGSKNAMSPPVLLLELCSPTILAPEVPVTLLCSFAERVWAKAQEQTWGGQEPRPPTGMTGSARRKQRERPGSLQELQDLGHCDKRGVEMSLARPEQGDGTSGKCAKTPN